MTHGTTVTCTCRKLLSPVIWAAIHSRYRTWGLIIRRTLRTVTLKVLYNVFLYSWWKLWCQIWTFFLYSRNLLVEHTFVTVVRRAHWDSFPFLCSWMLLSATMYLGYWVLQKLFMSLSALPEWFSLASPIPAFLYFCQIFYPVVQWRGHELCPGSLSPCRGEAWA